MLDKSGTETFEGRVEREHLAEIGAAGRERGVDAVFLDRVPLEFFVKDAVRVLLHEHGGFGVIAIVDGAVLGVLAVDSVPEDFAVAIVPRQGTLLRAETRGVHGEGREEKSGEAIAVHG